MPSAAVMVIVSSALKTMLLIPPWPSSHSISGFVKDNNPRLKLTFSAFLKDGADKLAFFLEFASEKKQLPNALWDSGYELAFSNGSKAVVVLKGSACFRIDWWPDGHPDDNTLGERLAVLLMNRVYGLDGG